MPEDEFDDGIDDDPFDDDEWRPTARIDMTDVRRKLESLDSEAQTYDMRKAPDISAELERRLKASLDDTVEAITSEDLSGLPDDEDIPTVLMLDGPPTLPEAPATRQVDLDAAILRAKQVTANKRALTLPSPTDELPTIEAATQSLLTRPRPAAGRTMRSAFDATTASAETLVRRDSTEEVPTMPRTMPMAGKKAGPAPRESERPRRSHGIERRPIVPARGAPLDAMSRIDSEEEIAIIAPVMAPAAPAVIRPFPQPNAPPAGDAELDALLTEMEVAQRRRNLAGPILLFLVLAVATAALVYMLN